MEMFLRHRKGTRTRLGTNLLGSFEGEEVAGGVAVVVVERNGGLEGSFFENGRTEVPVLMIFEVGRCRKVDEEVGFGEEGSCEGIECVEIDCKGLL